MHIWSAESCFIYICPSSQERVSHDTSCRAGLEQTLLSSTGKLRQPANPTVSGGKSAFEKVETTEQTPAPSAKEEMTLLMFSEGTQCKCVLS